MVCPLRLPLLSEADTETAIFVPGNTVHGMVATPEEDVIFYVVKDLTHGVAGLPADSVAGGAHYEPGFGPKGKGN